MIEPLFVLMRWIQTFPIATLMLTPFEEDDRTGGSQLRVGRKSWYLFSLTYFFLADLVLAVIAAAASVGGNRNIVVRDLSLAVVLAVYFTCWARAVRTPAVRKMLVGVIMLHYEAMLITLSNLFAALILGGRYLTEVNTDAGSLTCDLCLLAATALTYPLIWGFLRRILRKNLPFLDNRQIYRGLGYMCVVFLLYSVVTYLPSYERQPQATITLCSMIVTDMIAYYIFFQEIGAVRQLADYQMLVQRQSLEAQNYETIRRQHEEVMMLRHDMAKHFILLRQMTHEEQTASYLDQLIGQNKKIRPVVQSGNNIFDIILNTSIGRASDEGIAVEIVRIQVPERLPLSDTELSSLAMNLMDNALSGAVSSGEENPFIRLDLHMQDNFFLFDVENSAAVEQIRKKPEAGHGYGLKIVRQMVERRGGLFETGYHSGFYKAAAAIPLALPCK